MTTFYFTPTSTMTFATANADRQRLKKIYVTRHEHTLVIDLSTITHCDSAGLALLIEAKRLAKQYNKTCQIIGMSQNIQALAEFSGVEKMLY